MNLVTLRIQGTDEALHSLCRDLRLVADSMWKKGDPKRRGGCFSNSGLSATLVDAKNPVEVVNTIRAFAAKCKERSVVLASSDLSAELSIGVTVGDSEQFIANLAFSASDLLSLGAIGIELSIAAYPTSDKANEEIPHSND